MKSLVLKRASVQEERDSDYEKILHKHGFERPADACEERFLKKTSEKLGEQAFSKVN